SWEAGGFKVAVSKRFRIVDSAATQNNGPGFWFDMDNRDGLIQHSRAIENDGPGIFVEISERIMVRDNVCLRNGLKDRPGAWQNAGILLGEAMDSVVAHNICAGNRIGIEVRQQGIRRLESDPAHDRLAEKVY